MDENEAFLFNRKGNLIPLDETHHFYVARHPDLFFSKEEQNEIAKNCGVSCLQELCDRDDFLYEEGEYFEYFCKCFLKKGWLKLRTIYGRSYITCYDFKRDLDAILNLLDNNSELISTSDIYFTNWDGSDDVDADNIDDAERKLLSLFECTKLELFRILEAIEDFPKSTHGMYRFARRRHNDTGAVRKVSGQPYWVHPEGVALIVMKHGGSDIEIKAAMAHDVLEDTGDTFEDMVEKFGYEVASIVNEITNDKDEIKKVGKEKYISDELCRISDEALTVKLADMLYNQKDSPTESNYIRMRNNVNYMLNNRDGLLPIHKELAQEILDV